MRTVRGIFVPLLACVLVSCASVAKDDAPTCSSAAECDAKWKMAERWIVHRARRSVEHKGDDYMESVGTYGKALVVRVRKVPQGDGSWRIEAHIRCGEPIGCDPSVEEARRSFRQFVEMAWFEPPSRKTEGSD